MEVKITSEQLKLIEEAIKPQFINNPTIMFEYEQWDPNNKQQQLDKKLDQMIADETDVMLKHMYQEWQTINPPLGLNELANQRDMINKLELRIKELEGDNRLYQRRINESEDKVDRMEYYFDHYIKNNANWLYDSRVKKKD